MDEKTICLEGREVFEECELAVVRQEPKAGVSATRAIWPCVIRQSGGLYARRTATPPGSTRRLAAEFCTVI